jgi:predicted metalloprotease with PDZ domain
LRLAYSHYAGARGFTREQFRALAQDVAGTDLRAWFVSVLETTEELDYTEALHWFGLRCKTATPATSEKAWLGLVTRTDNGRLLVSQVHRQTPGWQYGFNVDDEILSWPLTTTVCYPNTGRHVWRTIALESRSPCSLPAVSACSASP